MSTPTTGTGAGTPGALHRIVLRGFRRSATGMIALLALLLASAAGAGAQQPGGFELQLGPDEGVHPTGSLFIEELDSIWTAAGEVVEGGSILIRDGIIEAVGPDLERPEGVEVLDGRGLTAIPGLVDEHSHTALDAINESTAPVVPEVRTLDALDPTDFDIYRALSGGVTTARLMHGSANPIGGQSAVVKMRWGAESGREMLFAGAPRFVKFALGENVTRKNFRPDDRPLRFPASRPGVEAVYVEAFTAAREYAREWARYRDTPSAYPVPPRRDLRLEALVDIMEGRIRIHAHSYRSDEILMLMRVAERFGFRIDVFTHVLEGYQVAREMAEHGAAGSTFSDWWQYKLEAFDAIPYNAALMHEQGVLTALNSDLSWLQSFMVHEIPKPVKYGGVSREEALRMLTLNPARMMHIDDYVGSLEPGKHGDVVLLNGDPFDAYVRVEKTVVDGIVYYDLSDESGTRDEPFHALPNLDPGVELEGAPSGDEPPGEPSDEAAAPPREELLDVRSFALVGARAHPVGAEPIDDAVVVVRNGRITAVGPRSEVPVPGDLRLVDATGRHVYPGMINPMTFLGLFEFGQSGNAADLEDTGRFNPHVRAISAVDMDNPAIGVARANGITTAFTAQRSGVVQGTGAVIQLRGRTWQEAALAPEAAVVVDFPAPREPEEDGGWTTFPRSHAEAAAGAATGRGSASSFTALPPAEVVPALQETDDPEPTLDGERMEELVELFRRAREYVAEPSVRNRATEPFWPNRWPGDRVALEAMAPALRGEVPVFFRADTEWQLRTLFLFLDEFPEVRAAVVGGAEAFRVADELADREVAVILTSAYSPTPNRDHSITASYRNAALLDRAGVTIAFATDDAGTDGLTRNLPYHAAHSVAFGLPRDRGLRAVTLGPAEILGIDASTGSLEAGKRADLIVTDGDPLQYLTRIERMWIGGVEVDPRDNKHDRLYERYRER